MHDQVYAVDFHVEKMDYFHVSILKIYRILTLCMEEMPVRPLYRRRWCRWYRKWPE